MTTTLIPPARPEYSRLERFYGLGRHYLAVGPPQKALELLERYLKWMPGDRQAAAAKDEALHQLQARRPG